ncbi:hypothetical protein INR49_023716 [Caranx melampygus]|nr:hypothetical protein INR49_023716 [Caranx melampygus]
MSTTQMSGVRDILQSLYRHIHTLEDFANSIVFREGQRAVLVEQSDTNRFKTFVKSVFVCFDKELQQVPSCNQICTLPELLAFVLNTLKRKRKETSWHMATVIYPWLRKSGMQTTSNSKEM